MLSVESRERPCIHAHMRMCIYIYIWTGRPRNHHRGQLEILIEHGFMTVSSVYAARERPRRNSDDGRRERLYTRKESKRFRREGDE